MYNKHTVIQTTLTEVLKMKVKRINPHQTLINRIHAATKLRGWTLVDTAEMLGISHVYLTAITSGARKLSGLNIEKQRELAKFIDISMLDFYLSIGVLREEDLVK